MHTWKQEEASDGLLHRSSLPLKQGLTLNPSLTHTHLGGKAARHRDPPVSTLNQFAVPGICGVEACHVDACIRSQNFYDCTASAGNLYAVFTPNPA